MPTAILPALLTRYPDLMSLPQDEIDRLVEEERQRYHRDIEAERGIPSGDPEEMLRAALPEEELPATAGLGVQEADMPGPEALGAYTQEDIGAPVPEEQAQRWMEEREVSDAKYKLQGLIRESTNYKQELIDKHFGGIDPTLRNVEKLGKELARVETKTAEQQIKEIIGKDDLSEMTPKERLAVFNAKTQAELEAKKTVRQQKQDDIATLQQAVSTFNAEQKAKMDIIERQRAEIQKLHTAQRKVAMEAEAARAKAVEKAKPKEPSPVTWTTATKQVEKRFGKQDPTGNIIITPQLAGMHRIAQKKLVELKRQGVKPLDAVNQAEDHARNIERRYFERIEQYPERRKEIQKEFKKKYGYTPITRTR